MKKTHFRYTVFGLLVTALVVAPLAIWALVVVINQPKATPSVGSTIMITGKIICLPHKDTNGPQTLECAFGIKDDETHKNYALKGVDHLQSELSQTNNRVMVKGTVVKPEKTQEKYDIAGVLDVQQVIK